jgi:hypothetical protein
MEAKRRPLFVIDQVVRREAERPAARHDSARLGRGGV